ncbi:MAG TPA: ribosome biogenesis GTP-binding protein YihA/YsxC [Xanthobacteraceae bacterium]
MSTVVGPSSGFSAAEIEAGRRLFAGEWDFVSAASSHDSLPAMAAPEIAFAGRSNVGKSSLINALTGRRALARTSNTPGRTQELIFFAPSGTAAGQLVLVDMPGYGYAAAAKSKIGAWTQLIHEFLHGRTTLARVYLLVDARHGLMAADQDILRTLDRAAVSYQIVLTKADRISAAELDECRAAVASALVRRPAAFPEILATSAQSGAGIAELRAAIIRLLRERG